MEDTPIPAGDAAVAPEPVASNGTQPPAISVAQLAELTIEPRADGSTETLSGTVKLSEPAPEHGLLVVLTSDNPTRAIVDRDVFIAPGKTTGQFKVQLSPSNPTDAVRITAQAREVKLTASIAGEVVSAPPTQTSSGPTTPPTTPAAGPSTRPPASGGPGAWAAIVDAGHGLIAALVITGPVAPVPGALLSAAMYISPIAPEQQLSPIGAAAVYLLLVWLGLAAVVWLLGFTAPERAGMGTYAELTPQLQEVGAWAEWSDSQTAPPRSNISAGAWHLARTELGDQLAAIQRERRARGARWVLATGYMTLWRCLHRAQEAMIEIAPPESVIKYAQYDVLRITNSTMVNSDTYIALLTDAIKVLSIGRDVDASLDRLIAELDAIHVALGNTGRPGAEAVASIDYRTTTILADLRALPSAFDNTQLADKLAAARGRFGDATFDIDALRQDLQLALTFLRALASTTSRLNSPGAPSTGLSAPRSAAEATALVRTIRHMVHDFRDDSRSGLVRARNQLLGTAGFTAITVYALLWSALLSRVTVAAVEAAISFYLIGAVIGLFSRLYSESKSDSGVDDFGLSLTRLLTAPLLSGLAGVLGVVLLSMAATTQGQVQAGALADAFDLGKTPLNLVTAAVFGLTPGLLLDQLSQKTEQFKQDLKSSQPSSTSG